MSGRRLQRGIIRILEYLLAPGVCLGCGCDPGDHHSLCASCRELIKRVPNPCQYCGQPNPLAGLICPACRLNPPRWQKIIAPLQYRGLTRDYLLQLKYSEALYLAKSLCQQAIDPFCQNWPRPEVLLPVPLHRERLLERGYNQAGEIAQVLSAELDNANASTTYTRRLPTRRDATIAMSPSSMTSSRPVPRSLKSRACCTVKASSSSKYGRWRAPTGANWYFVRDDKESLQNRSGLCENSGLSSKIRPSIRGSSMSKYRGRSILTPQLAFHDC